MSSCGLYIRVSKNDKHSNSIKNQIDVLTKYCLNNNFNIFKIYVDNGYTGTNFDRPDFKRMLNDIKYKLIDLVIVKDLSRLGRDYIEIGYYLDYFFKENNVSFIAVNDGISASNINYFQPIKNIFNEYYALDISKKVKFTLNNLKEKYIKRKTARPLYGFDRNFNVDYNVSWIINLIYSLYQSGDSIRTIKQKLESKKIESPAYYFNRVFKQKYSIINPNMWHLSTISNILKTEEYIGTLILNKTEKQFKRKKVIIVEDCKRIKIKNKTEKIIDKNLYDEVQKIKATKINNFKIVPKYFSNVYCEICSEKMRYKCDKRKDGSSFIRLTCRCNHKIDKPSILIDDLNEFISYASKTYKINNICKKISKLFISRNLTNIKYKKCIYNNIRIEFL